MRGDSGPDGGEDFLDDLFGSDGEIFRQRELVDISHVPDLERVVGRDAQIEDVAATIAPGTRGEPPGSATIYGKTGAGKSLVARSTIRAAATKAAQNGTNLAYAYVDCSNDNTEARASSTLARRVADQVDADREIPRTGYAASQYRDMAWELLDEHDVGAFIVILDEIDLLDDENVLRSLSRAKESGQTDAHVGVISISNKVEYRQKLNARVDSSLQDQQFVFDPYDANQLRAILDKRRDAFQEDVLDDGVIPRIAALAAQEHGDARKAVDMLYWTGWIAERSGASEVTEEFVDEANRRAEVNQFESLISGSPPHAKYLLRSLALLTANQTEEGFGEETPAFKTSEIYDFYTTLTDRMGVDALSRNRVIELLEEQAFLGITENERTGGGRGSGMYKVHRLLQEPEIVIEATAPSEARAGEN